MNQQKKSGIRDPYKEYYARIDAEKRNNLNISFKDVSQYDMKPFDLKKPFVTDGNFTAIALEGKNLKIAKNYLKYANKMISSYKHLFVKPFPKKITTDYILNQKLPYSHLRLYPYAFDMSARELPLLLWLSYFGYYGNEYLYRIYFDQNGDIGECDLRFYNYTVQVWKNDGELYVRKISETLKVEPYGTKTLYLDKRKKEKK